MVTRPFMVSSSSAQCHNHHVYLLAFNISIQEAVFCQLYHLTSMKHRGDTTCHSVVQIYLYCSLIHTFASFQFSSLQYFGALFSQVVVSCKFSLTSVCIHHTQMSRYINTTIALVPYSKNVWRG